jgi:hypothetical protein
MFRLTGIISEGLGSEVDSGVGAINGGEEQDNK